MTSNVFNNPLKNLASVTSVRPATAMDAAAMFGHLEILKFLQSIRSVRGITHPGGDLNLDLPTITLNAMNGAAAFGHLDVVKWLYDNERARCSCQALISAARNQRFDIVEWLIENRPGTFLSDVIFVALAASAPARAVDWMKTHPIEDASFILWVVSANKRLQILQLLHEKLSWDRSCYEAAFGGAIHVGAFDVLLYLELKCVEDGIADMLMPGVRDQVLADMALPTTIKSWIRETSPII